MNDLTKRQETVLKTIIDEYIETAEAVGSETLDKKYSLGVSPATLRNEMVRLTEMGLLRQPHPSAGRAPTPAALKYYVSELMKPKPLSIIDEVRLKEKIQPKKQAFEKLMREATKILAEKTRSLALAFADDGALYYAGTANILDMPEFYDIDLTRSVLGLLDKFDFWEDFLDEEDEGEQVHLLLGEDLGQHFLAPCGFVHTHYHVGPRKGAIGVVGPCRLDFPLIIPMVGYLGELLEDL